RATAVTLAPVWTERTTNTLHRELSSLRSADIEIALARSPQIHDGRFAGNAWLQELPHPITKQTWGNAALMSPGTARKLRARDGSLVEVATATGMVALPALVVPGAADDS